MASILRRKCVGHNSPYYNYNAKYIHDKSDDFTLFETVISVVFADM